MRAAVDILLSTSSKLRGGLGKYYPHLLEFGIKYVLVNYNISPPPFWKFLLLLFIWFLQCCICRCYKLCRAIWYTAQMPHHKSWYCAPKLSKGNIDRRQSNSPIGKNVTGQKWSVFLGSRVIYKKIYKTLKGSPKNHGLKDHFKHKKLQLKLFDWKCHPPLETFQKNRENLCVKLSLRPALENLIRQ